ncbi:MAG: leucine-rich repeat protein [Bacteroidales bacterium]|nr:leucine-rich repeat protein [Bacteroidales bacterium]
MTKTFAFDFSAVCSTGQTLYYNITDTINHYVEITYPGSSSSGMWEGYTRPSGNITLPSSVDYNGIAYAVKSIGDFAFSNCSGLTGNLTIPSSVTTIGDYAFNRCSGFTGNLTIPNSVTTIGDYAFDFCSGFTGSLTIPSSVTTIGYRTFDECSGFTALTIPNTVTKIDYGAFWNCSGFTGALTIPNSVTTIGNIAFSGCSGFTGSLTIPNSVATIGNNAFLGCSGFTGSLTIGNSVTTIGGGAFDGCSGFTGSLTIPNSVTTIGGDAFDGCSGFTGSLTIPNSVITIGNNAFFNCSGFTGSLTIGNSVTTIGEYAFKGCSGFTSMIVLAATPPSINYINRPSFGSVPKTIPVYVPCGTGNVYESTMGWNEFSEYHSDISLNIVTSVNPSWGGVVSGGGDYCISEICTLTATTNEGYTFVNWTENGDLVSSNPIYSFSVLGARTLVANFVPSNYEIIVAANPPEGGIVTGEGNYNHGTTVTLTATANEGYTFQSWTCNGTMVSTDATYTFIVTEAAEYVANFSSSTNYWEPEISQYEDNMTFTCVLQLDGVEQYTTMLEVGAFCGEECRGSQRATYFAPTNRYIIQMTVFGEVNDVISFRLFDHQQNAELILTPPTPVPFTTNGYGTLFNPYILNFTSTVQISAEANPVDAGEITGTGDYIVGAVATLTANANEGYQFKNWTLNGVVVSNSASYQFTVIGAGHYVANFQYVHTQALSNGWSWWSSYIELSNINGLEQLENSLANNGLIIKSRTNGYVEAYQYNGETNWYGTLSSINNEQMYKIRTNAACNATIAGMATMPSSHPISIKNGWNWIGFPCNQNVSVDVAMSGFTPENNDVLKGRNGFTTYYSDDNYSMWYGTLNTLEPGKGYMYRSNSATQKTLVFQSGRGEATTENVTTENNYFQPASGDFADNMTITAVLELDGEELHSEDYELAAFVGDECRGSVKLLYVEPVNRYVAFLIVFGEPSETLHFRLTDGRQTELSVDEVTFVADGMVGTLAEPMTLHFGMTQVNENELPDVMVYPNPSQGVFNIQGQGIRKVEVFNAFGQVVVSEETSNDNMQVDLSRYANGYYMLRVITDNGIRNSQLIKK